MGMPLIRPVLRPVANAMPAGLVPIRLSCACGGTSPSAMAGPGEVWTCPSCERAWRPDAEAVARVTAAAIELRKVRRLMGVLLAVAIVVAAVLVIVHPAWILGAPLLIGGVALAARPTYRKRRERATRALRTVIPLSVV